MSRRLWSSIPGFSNQRAILQKSENLAVIAFRFECRLGFSFADGTSWKNVVTNNQLDDLARPVGGSAGGNGCTQGFWVAALPPPGEFTIHALWPSVGMPECSGTLSADALIAAAQDELWLIDWDK